MKPHTPEWFQALRKFNRKQADHTAMILEKTGRSDVCSICGDDPANDYEIQIAAPVDGAVTTIKLCDDCRGIRSRAGEKFIPLSD